MRKLRITNIVMSGKLPFKKKLNHKEVTNLILKGKFHWQLVNEEISPILSAHIEKEGMTVHHTKKNAHVSIWTSGSINIVGIQSRKEGERLYDKTLKEVKKICPRVFRDG